MLSILIPCYNYNCLSLVKELHQKSEDQKVDFEILVSEDGGRLYIESNRKINSLSNCRYIENKSNLGRAGNINRLLNSCKFNLKLILDCDVLPKSKDFIQTYLDFAQDKDNLACFGGISYKNHNQCKSNLRYNYGVKHEAKPAHTRQKEAYKFLLTSNILIKNCDVKFDNRITNYGYDDLVFAKELKKRKINAYHINNVVYHLNLEDNSVYFKKTETALNTLIFLEKKKIIATGETRISSLYHQLRGMYLSGLLRLSYKLFGNSIKTQILKKGGPIYLFHLYKLLYFSKHY